MSIADKKPSRAIRRPKYPGGYVVPQRVIWDFVADQKIRDIDAIEARMRGVHEATQALLHGDNLRAQKSRIEDIASQTSDARWKRIMNSIIDAVQDGEEGIWAASSTAVRIVELIGR
jgi:hypothetical protein